MKFPVYKIVFIALLQGLALNLQAHVELDYPVGGETLTSGQTVTIEWHESIAHITLNWDLLFSTDGGMTWEFIQMDIPVGQLSYQWIVPSIETGLARVSVIQDNDGMDYQDESLNFTIQLPLMLPYMDIEPVSITLECHSNQETTIQSWLDGNGGATAVNFCGNLAWTNDYDGLNNNCGATGTSVVTFTATDECGSTSLSASVTIIDTEPPVMAVQANNQVVECDGIGNIADFNTWINNEGGATASDECGNVSWTNNFSAISNDCGSTGNTTVTFIATDDCGNSVHTTATFSIEDTTAPGIITSAQDTAIDCGTPNLQSVIQNWLVNHGGATAGDICGNITWTNDLIPLFDTCDNTISQTVTFTATDECINGITSTAVITLLGPSGTSVPISADFDFKISPNPVTDILKFEIEKSVTTPIQLTLFNLCGKPIASFQEIVGEVFIPVNEYPSGIYFVQVKSLRGAFIQKVILE